MPLVKYESDLLQDMITIHNKCTGFADNEPAEAAYDLGEGITDDSQYFLNLIPIGNALL